MSGGGDMSTEDTPKNAQFRNGRTANNGRIGRYDGREKNVPRAIPNGRGTGRRPQGGIAMTDCSWP